MIKKNQKFVKLVHLYCHLKFRILSTIGDVGNDTRNLEGKSLCNDHCWAVI
jgi:hypothetical protein